MTTYTDAADVFLVVNRERAQDFRAGHTRAAGIAARARAEDEAKTKWCPFVRLLCYDQTAQVGASYNRFDRSDMPQLSPNANCIASACMAWRMGMPRLHDGVEVGYCGLAGKP